MKRPTPFAVGFDGEVYMSVYELDDVRSSRDVLRVVRQEAAFIGVRLSAAERRRLVGHLADAGSEAGGFIAGRRRWGR